MVNTSSEITSKPNPSAPPLEKADFAPPDEPASNNGNVPIDIDTMPVASAVPIVRNAAVGGIVLDSPSAKHAKENNSKCSMHKKIVIVSMVIIAIIAIGAGLAIALSPQPQPVPEPNALGDDSTIADDSTIVTNVPEVEAIAIPSEPDEPVLVDTPEEVIENPESSCSLGADLTTCTTDASCTELEVENCSMYCRDEYACRDTKFFDSVVACFGRRSCLRGTFQRSQVTCSKDKDSPCYGSNFYASAVTCEDGFSSCWYADFDECSCCDGPDCPDDIPKCSGLGSNLPELCSTQLLGKTCKDWGNPACFEVSSGTVLESQNPTVSNEAAHVVDDVVEDDPAVVIDTSRCITRSGEQGHCLDTSVCTGTAVPWSPGDPEPSCFTYPKGVQCCIEAVKSFTDESKANIIVVEDIPKAPCSLNEDVVVCSSSDRDCSSFIIDSCSVYCQDKSSCQDADIDSSTVECIGERSCSGASFHHSDVTCADQERYVCRDAEFIASAVTCEDGYYTCDEDMFYPCSCCKSLSPECHAEPCFDRMTETADKFCSSLFLGKTCKAWGNPICDGVAVTTLTPIHPALTCSLGEDVAVCDSTDRSCNNFEIENCSIYCKDACQNAAITESTVECVGQSSCRGATFRQSDVTCSNLQRYACQNAKFIASAVTCEDGYYTCDEDMFYPCSCCKSLSPECHAEPCFDRMTGTADAFCSSTFLGKTCKAWGNPICESTSANKPSPLHPSMSCSLGEDVAVCDSTDRSCNNLEIENCSVYCYDACQDTDISASTVECVGQSSCRGATFRQSDVTCSNLQRYACQRANFIASAVKCEDGFYTCQSTTFDPCSCCDGVDCPSGIAHCSGSGLQDFCSSAFLGKTCKDWGNPACNA